MAAPANAAATMPPFDAATAAAMLTRTLQAQERNDFAAVQNDLFPRASHTLQACGKARLAYSRATSIGMADEAGGAPAKVTGVTLGSPRAHKGGYLVDYKAVGNPAFSGSEHFVWANGRWWIKCQM